MPTVLRKDGFRFFFYSADWHEPMHIHVEYADGLAKFWLEPVLLESSYKLKTKDINKAEKIIEENHLLMKKKWNEYFSRKD